MKFLIGAFVALTAGLALAAPANAGVFGAFSAECQFSHRAQDDPIVNFGMPGGASHIHDFSGSRTTNAYSTPASIRGGATNCVRTDSVSPDSDRSAYWVPTLYVDNKIVQESAVGTYYSTGQRSGAGIQPFPAGLKVIAGSANGGPQMVDGERVWLYSCPGGTRVGGTATTAPTCNTNLMYLTIRFQDCWNGVSLDSPDHKSHMGYSRKAAGATLRTCPSAYPVMMPQLQMQLRYPTAGGTSVRLSSGAINTAHADFMNGWDQAKLTALVRNCLNPDKYCGGGDMPNVKAI